MDEARRRPDGRRYPAGAEVVEGGTSFRVWAPGHARVAVVVDGREHPLAPDRDGYAIATVAGVGAGATYRYRLDGGDPLTDPTSRFQPDGPLGRSEVVDPRTFRWTDAGWRGLILPDQVFYEMHVGTFTPEGTWAAATDKLPFLKRVGVTAIEMMPVNEFAGAFGWGYDGVDLFAPTRLYGRPDDLRAFVDRAHALGLGVILDVVYNHFGPVGNVLPAYSPHYFTDRYVNDWGEAPNFDGPHAQGMRELAIANAAYWVDEFHFDGLRLDATQSIHDASGDHVIAALARAARAAAGDRSIVIVAENEPQLSDLVRPADRGGFGLDAVWNDDFHHSALVAVTGRREAYYEDHWGAPQEFVSAAKYGYLYQGQTYGHQRHGRGVPGLDIKPEAFVNFVENHDQVANSGRGLRFHLLTDPGRARALTAVALLMPGTPMLFQGQEFWASTPFLYFADHDAELAAAVRKGRADFLSQFQSLATAAAQARLRDPASPDTVRACVLDWREAETNAGIVALHRDLLAMRTATGAFRPDGRLRVDGAVLAAEAFGLRFFAEDDDDRLLLVNFGPDLRRRSVPDPLVAPPRGRTWTTLWSSEDPVYGGTGSPPVETAAGWSLSAHTALVLGPV